MAEGCVMLPRWPTRQTVAMWRCGWPRRGGRRRCPCGALLLWKGNAPCTWTGRKRPALHWIWWALRGDHRLTEDCVSIPWYGCALVVAFATGCKDERHQVVIDSEQAGLRAAVPGDSLHGLGIAADSVNAVQTAAPPSPSSPSAPPSPSSRAT